MTHIPLLFHQDTIIKHTRRSAESFADHNFIHVWAAREMCDRVALIKRDFKKILVLSSRQSHDFKRAFPSADIKICDASAGVLGPEDIANEHAYDLILSLGDLHRVNDLPGMLVCIRRALKPDGVFLACFPGGETLQELRASLLHGEMETLGGASPRVLPFVDKQQAGALLQRAGFSLPVVDSDILHVSYRDLFQLMADLRGMGESNCLFGRYPKFTPSRLFFNAAQYYASHFADPDDRIKASFEIVFMIGWAPHDGQPQPLKPGSGKVHLTDVL